MIRGELATFAGFAKYSGRPVLRCRRWVISMEFSLRNPKNGDRSKISCFIVPVDRLLAAPILPVEQIVVTTCESCSE
jgi:hypothetical protein